MMYKGARVPDGAKLDLRASGGRGQVALFKLS